MTAPGRRSSTFTRLLRHGFTDPSAAERLLESAELAAIRNDPVLPEALGATAPPAPALLAPLGAPAPPALALQGLVRLREAQPEDTPRRELLGTPFAASRRRD